MSAAIKGQFLTTAIRESYVVVGNDLGCTFFDLENSNYYKAIREGAGEDSWALETDSGEAGASLASEVENDSGVTGASVADALDTLDTAVSAVVSVTDGDKGDITVSASGATWTLDNAVVSLAKMANIATDRLIGRDTAGTGVPEALGVGAGLLFSGSGSLSRAAFTGGDVVGGQDSASLTIENLAVTSAKIAVDAVSNSKLDNMAEATIKGRAASAGTGDPQDLTGAQVLTVLGISALTDGDKGDITVSASGATWTVDNDAVTYAKIQNVSTGDRLLGRGEAAGAGDVQEITLASSSLEFNSGQLRVKPLSGDVTSASGSPMAATITNDAVTYAKIQNVSATDRLLGRVSASSGDVEEVVFTDLAQTLLDDTTQAAMRTTIGVDQFQTLSSAAATIVYNAALGVNASVVLNDSVTTSWTINFTNLVAGMRGLLLVQQDDTDGEITGLQVAGFGGSYNVPAGTLSTLLDTTDRQMLEWFFDGTVIYMWAEATDLTAPA